MRGRSPHPSKATYPSPISASAPPSTDPSTSRRILLCPRTGTTLVCPTSDVLLKPILKFSLQRKRTTSLPSPTSTNLSLPLDNAERAPSPVPSLNSVYTHDPDEYETVDEDLHLDARGLYSHDRDDLGLRVQFAHLPRQANKAASSKNHGLPLGLASRGAMLLAQKTMASAQPRERAKWPKYVSPPLQEVSLLLHSVSARAYKWCSSTCTTVQRTIPPTWPLPISPTFLTTAPVTSPPRNIPISRPTSAAVVGPVMSVIPPPPPWAPRPSRHPPRTTSPLPNSKTLNARILHPARTCGSNFSITKWI